MNAKKGNLMYLIALAVLAGAMMMLGVFGTASSTAVASQDAQVSKKAKPSKKFKKRYAKAKRSMRRCQWRKAYRQFVAVRRPAVKFYGYRAYHNLAVTAYSSGKKKPARRWARLGVLAAQKLEKQGKYYDQLMSVRMMEIYNGSYVVSCR